MRLRVKVTQAEAGEFRAFSPSLPGCISRGATAHEALERFLDNSRGYLAALNNFVPERLRGELVEA